MAGGFKTSNTNILVGCYVNFNTAADLWLPQVALSRLFSFLCELNGEET
jgi:hypothetical protein